MGRLSKGAHTAELMAPSRVGKRLAMGAVMDEQDAAVVQALRAAGVSVIEGMVISRDQGSIHRLSQRVVAYHGAWAGGDQVVLDALACRTPVEVAPSNSRLAELASLSHVPGHREHAQMLLRAMCLLPQLAPGDSGSCARPPEGTANAATWDAVVIVRGRRGA